MKAISKIRIHVGSIDEMGERFSSAWKRAADGKHVDETHVTFLDMETMVEALSPRRLELLKYVHRHGAESVRELAERFGRDYKNVHQDVTVLESAGLLIREGRKLMAPWDELQASVSLNH